MRQHIHYLKTSDGVYMAWAKAGRGPALVKPANWLTHLEYDWESPVWRHWMHFLAGHFRFIRHDERGCGMTDWHAGDLSPERWTDDLECVIEKAGIDEPMILLGISQGAVTAIRYAAKYPERVSKLVLYGGYARGWARRESPDSLRFFRAMLELMARGWNSDNPTFRQVFTSRFLPEATEEQVHWFNDLCRRTTSGDVAVRLMEARSEVDVTEYLERIRVPTLVVHARDDEVVPVSEGRLLASTIPGADFVELDSRNHILLEHEPAWQEFKQQLLAFVGLAEAESSVPEFADLSPREAAILGLISEGLTNQQVAERLDITEKTVRNHVSSLFAKLGVHSRAQAIVLARDKGFSG